MTAVSETQGSVDTKKCDSILWKTELLLPETKLFTLFPMLLD